MGGTILVVEDDREQRRVLRAIFEDAGYAVALAGNALEALRWLDAARPALIVLDLRMPDLSGPAFAAELQCRGLRPAIPVLVLSAVRMAAQEARRIGAEGYVPKPFDLEQLLAEAGRLLG